MDKRWLLVAAVLGLVVAWQLWRKHTADRIDSAEAHRLVSAGARLIDVRTPAEFSAGHIEGARNVPLQELPARMGELGPREDPLVLYCRSGRRSNLARTKLEAEGFTAVYDLGPMSAW